VRRGACAGVRGSAVGGGGERAGGARGAGLAGDGTALKRHGEEVRGRAEVESSTELSAHAEYEEILRWRGTLQRAPVRTFVTHGEPAAADAMRRRIAERLHWPCQVPGYAQCVHLDAVESGATLAPAALSSRRCYPPARRGDPGAPAGSPRTPPP
ncbi:hypothetical protein DWU95_47700, partial [Burkholderia contaminans]